MNQYTAKIVALLIIQSLIPFAYGQFTVSHVKRPDTNPANTEFNRAEKLAFQAQYDSAIGVFQNAIVKFAKRNDWVGVAECYNRIGDNFKEKAKFDSALYYSNRALECALDKLGNQHSALIRIYNSIGFVFWNVAEYDSSLQYYNKAIAIRHSEKDPDIAQTYFCLALYYRVKGNYDMALDYHNKALAIRLEALGPDNIEVAHSYHAMGLLYNVKEDYGMAKEYLEKALQIKQMILSTKHPNLAHTFNSLGNLCLQKNDDVMGLKYFNKALAIWVAAYDDHHPDVAMIYRNFGLIYGSKGDYDRSVEYHRKAMEIKLELFGENFIGLIITYKDIGFAHQIKGDYEKALDYYNKALSLSISHYGKMNSNTAACYKYLASAYFYMGNHDKSIEFWNNFLDMTLRISGPFNPDMGYGYRCLGGVYEKKEEYGKALELYQKGLSIYLKTSINSRFRIGEISNDMGSVYLKQAEYLKALGWIQRGITSLVVDFGDTNIYSNPPLNHFLDENELFISLKLKAECFEKIYSVESHNLKDLQMSLINYELAAELTNRIRQGYKTEGSKLNLVVETNNIYERAIKVALDLYSQTKNENYKKKAFAFAERSKSVILLDAMSDLQAKAFVSIPDSLLDKERDIRVDITFYETQLMKERSGRNDSARIRIMEDRLFSLKYNHEALVRNFETNYPVYHNLKFNTVSASVDEIQRSQLDNDQVMLEFFVGKSSLVIYAISAERFEIRSLAKDSALEASVKAFRKSLLNLDPEGYLTNASKLYQWLIHPVAENIRGYKKLLIVPDGILNYVPFEALLTKEVESYRSADFTKLPYFIEDYQISYYYSSKLFMQRLHEPGMAVSFLGLAPVFSDSGLSGRVAQGSLLDISGKDVYSDLTNSVSIDGKTFSSLPYTETELREISILFEQQNLPNKICLYDRATEKMVKSDQMSQYKFIHIASHGFINESNPKLSGIVFSQKDSTEDGILYAGEIYNLALKADLVVLSACESGMGKIVRGEGIMSMTRGFIYSGTKNVIVSLWQVRDQSTAVLMKQLYEGVLAGQSYTYALHQAKLKLIQNPKYAYPLDWSPFVLIGQ